MDYQALAGVSQPQGPSPVVFVVDDHPQLRQSCAALVSSLNLAVETFCSAEHFLEGCDPAQPGCAVVDFRLPGMDGIELHRHLRERGCSMPVILISAHLNVRVTAIALEHGVFRVVEKPYGDEELTVAILDAIRYDHETRNRSQHRLDFAHRLESLDPRERATLSLVIAGHSNKAIERRLGMGTRTVDRVRSSILEKMSALSFVELSAAYGAYQEAAPSEKPPVPLCPVSMCEKTAEDLAAALLRLQAILNQEVVGEGIRQPLRDIQSTLATALARIRGGNA